MAIVIVVIVVIVVRTYRDHVAGEQGPADDRQALVEVRETWRRSCVV